MQIDGINISSFGLELIAFENYYGQPARKKIHEDPLFNLKDIVFESKEPIVTLLGTYQTLADMYNKNKAFMDHIRSSVKHDYILDEHGEVFTGVILKSIKPVKTGLALELKFTITIVE